jgi:hypothetical protein
MRPACRRHRRRPPGYRSPLLSHEISARTARIHGHRAGARHPHHHGISERVTRQGRKSRDARTLDLTGSETDPSSHCPLSVSIAIIFFSELAIAGRRRMANYGVSTLYLNALHDFEEKGYCVVRGLLDPADLAPVVSVVEKYVDARASQLRADGHISSLCEDASFESRWARLRAQVEDRGRGGPIGATSNWGAATNTPMGPELLLAEPVHTLYRSPAITKLAGAMLDAGDVYSCGNFWFRPMTCGDSQGH